MKIKNLNGASPMWIVLTILVKYTSGFSTVPLDLSTRGKIEEFIWYCNLRLAVFVNVEKNKWLKATIDCSLSLSLCDLSSRYQTHA